MLFNSIIFLLFFSVVFVLYWRLGRHVRIQNVLLLVASYFFYGWWDWRFLSLLAFSTVFDFFVSKKMGTTDDSSARKQLVLASVFSNLGILGVFKYFNFFADSLEKVFSAIGFAVDPVTLSIALPVGISFYTFQTLGYTIDVYRRQVRPVDSLLDFAVYVSFFPQLVAGPIERASTLLPQIQSPRSLTPERLNAGTWLILWGYFKKVFIADNVAKVSDTVFNGYLDYAGVDLVIGALAFTLQIYCDFSGYTDIARGVSKLLGFDLMVNFRLPYFAKSPSDFWDRWHISLSSWLRDYLYIPLGGNRAGRSRTYLNLFLTMLLGGLWHGAAWNFVFWGAYHGSLLILYRAWDDRRKATTEAESSGGALNAALRMSTMFALTVIGWILFRCSSVDQISHFFSAVGFSTSPESVGMASSLAILWAPLLIVQIFQHRSQDLLVIANWHPIPRAVVFVGLVVVVLLRGVRNGSEFIYFQF